MSGRSAARSAIAPAAAGSGHELDCGGSGRYWALDDTATELCLARQSGFGGVAIDDDRRGAQLAIVAVQLGRWIGLAA